MIKNNIKVIILHAITFTLGILTAFYVILGLEPCPYLGVTNRAINYTNKECYNSNDIELIIFGKVNKYVGRTKKTN